MTTSLPRRKSSIAAEKRLQSQFKVVEEEADEPKNNGSSKGKRKSSKSNLKASNSDEGSEYDDKESPIQEDEFKSESPQVSSPQTTKKRKVSLAKTNGKSNDIKKIHKLLFDKSEISQAEKMSSEIPPRTHTILYHRPLLLDLEKGSAYRSALLEWFDKVSEDRSMPWRKAWIDPRKYDQSSKVKLRSELERRAYEVWISEIMLQQTRVSVVIDYWNRWMAKWPTIQDVAAAASEEILFAWKGLGYYSRAARIHEAAKLVVKDKEMNGLLPSTAEELQAKVPGIGRYTGGAISAIVFGKAEPMVDGNVFRVLSRQLGLYANVKTDKQVIDTLWAAADSLVKHVAQDQADRVKKEDHDGLENHTVSDGPGRWGQALMELGSTICTPKPDCASCPITQTCRAYAEGRILASKAGLLTENIKTSSIKDIEDLCTLCEPYEDVSELTNVEGTSKKVTKPSKDRQATLTSFSFTTKANSATKNNSSTTSQAEDMKPNLKAMEVITEHAKKFPIKVIKKAVREEETLVCAIQDEKGRFLIHKRPEKGLLAGMWELPSEILPSANDSTSSSRKKIARQYFDQLMKDEGAPKKNTYMGELDSIPWLFSHLRLTMHVHLFRVQGTCNKSDANQRWATPTEVEGESMGTGMRKCWTLVNEAA